jgi:hypothetical protein
MLSIINLHFLGEHWLFPYPASGVFLTFAPLRSSARQCESDRLKRSMRAFCFDGKKARLVIFKERCHAYGC